MIRLILQVILILLGVGIAGFLMLVLWDIERDFRRFDRRDPDKR